MKSQIGKFFESAAVSLQYRNMRIYCQAAFVSLLGSLMQESMIAWVAYELTGSTAVLGNIMAWFMVPMVVASIPGGWVSDRFNRKRTVMITQTVALGVALSYMIMALTGTISIPAIYALSAVLGVTVAFEMSSRMAMVPQLVDKPEHIGNAFALDSLIFYGTRLLGPAMGAFFLMVTGSAGGFAANALSYVFELIMLAKLRPNPVDGNEEKASLREALVFAYGNRRRRQVLLLLAVVTFFGVYIQMMPAFTGMRHGEAWTNGFLIFCSEIGAVVASAIIAAKTANASFARAMRTGIGWAGILFAVCLAAFSMTSALVPSLLLMIPTGFAMSAVFSGSQAVLQVEVENRVRGAFTAMFYNFSYFGMLALGGPLLGHVASVYGLTATMCGAAALCALASAVYLCLDRLDSTPVPTANDRGGANEQPAENK
jgi:MFS family permease